MCAKLAKQPKFKPDDQVRLRPDPGTPGTIRKVWPSKEHGFLYYVDFGSADWRFIAEADLLRADQIIVDGEPVTCRKRLADLRREVLLAKVASRRYGESLYSLRGSRVEFHVYQFKPVLKFLRNPEQRLLLADEVGLGKTIEAGIIMTELQARVDLSRTLVVCPASLKAKWHAEMRSRFEQDFQEMDAQALRRFFVNYENRGESEQLKGIVSIELLRQADFIERLAEDQVHFDLVIIDEAHHCQNPETKTHELAAVLSENADAMLLLTATPLALGNQDLFHLLQILSPGEFDDLHLFEERIRPNRYVNNASRLLGANQPERALEELKKVERTVERRRYTNNPYYPEVQELLMQRELGREQVLQAQRMLLDLNTLAHVFTRTRKREVVVDAPLREAKVLRFEFHPAEQAFYDAVVRFVRQHWLGTKDQPWSVGFALVMRERQAASCIPAFRDNYVNRMRRMYWDEEDHDMTSGLPPDGEPLENLLFPERVLKAAQQLLVTARHVRSMDTKFDHFLSVLREVLASDPDAKVLVFSFFRKTLEYLYDRLRDLGIGAALIHGGVAVRDRHEIIESFRETKEISVLLSSEVGSEGIDLQFCHVVFNYDLPWNPMKVEQRIGRVDRFGQRSLKINIYNFVASGTIEDRIYGRLYERIRIFEESIGDLEAILGEVMRDLTRQVYRKELTPAEEIRLTDQAAAIILRKKQELEEFDKHRLEFMGQDAIFEQELRDAVESGRFVSEEELCALVSTYLQSKFPKARLEKNAEDETWCLELSDQVAERLRELLYNLGPLDRSHTRFLHRLLHPGPIPLTFSDEIAYERKLVEFVNLRHPLARAAVAHWETKAAVAHSEAKSDGDYRMLVAHIKADLPPPGKFYFFVFVSHTKAVRVEERMIPVVISPHDMQIVPRLRETFLRIVQQGEEVQPGNLSDFKEDEFIQARGVALDHMEEMRSSVEQEARKLNDALVSSRLASLERTYEAKSSRVQGYLAKASDSRIRRMREAQLRNLEARFEADRADLEARRAVTITFSLRLAGVLRLESQSA